ncbi:hypothetical protein TUMEXPCC7403_12310 [Tumidithrix helvetica PCC 7403]|uniref:hypothetical protein n=1 Tax=Tumidithrix helvetica TaxID=3457545 RepID=UPI003CA012AB
MSRKSHSRKYFESPVESTTSSDFSDDRDFNKTTAAQVNHKINQYLCLVPVFGVIPSVLALISDRSDRKLKDVSKVAIVMALAWLISSGASGSGDSATTQASLEILKGTISSTYFAASIWLMFRLYKDKAIALPGLKYLIKSKRRSD